jgi:hypothetical protein
MKALLIICLGTECLTSPYTLYFPDYPNETVVIQPIGPKDAFVFQPYKSPSYPATPSIRSFNMPMPYTGSLNNDWINNMIERKRIK